MSDKEKALTIRVPDELARRLAIHRALSGEPTNALAVRLFESYLATEGRKTLVDAGFDRVDEQYRTTLDKLA
jgi:predicted transcriptional regulator